MKRLLTATVFLSLSGLALAGSASIKNADGEAHKLKLNCGSSTSTRSIQSMTVITVPDGCKVTVDGSDTEEVTGKCTIKSGDLSCG